MSNAPTNIALGGRFGKTIALSCHFEGARYHVWINAETFEPDDVLYKNPIGIGGRREPGYFGTRHLRLDGAIGRKVVPTLLAAVPALIGPFREAKAAAEAAKLAEHAEDIRVGHIKRAAVPLFEACEAVIAHRKRDHLDNEIEPYAGLVRALKIARGE